MGGANQIEVGSRPGGGPPSQNTTARIIRSYDSAIIRAYCTARFRIIRGRFLEEITQVLPSEGRALEIGCGFGLFGLYIASALPDLILEGIDVDASRIAAAYAARDRLGIGSISFAVGDARELAIPDGLDAIYMLDLLHHLEPEQARELLAACRRALKPGGVLVIKDVDTRPRAKMAFTWVLDVLMTAGDRPHYWSRDDLIAALRGLDLEVFHYAMVDVLPYPHWLFVCRALPTTDP